MRNLFLSDFHPGTSIEGLDLSPKGYVLGNRIPREYFITTGTGESDIAIHAGSFHLALKNAGIEMTNVITYSSILPGIAKEIQKPHAIMHGEVMESIMAVANGMKGERVSAGIIYGWLVDRKSGQRYGGLVCEHNGNYPEEELDEKLNASLQELYVNGFEEDFLMQEIYTIKQSFVPRKTYGTALVALCFTNYFYPIIEV
ncbi:MAG: arginine decarboxylase [Bacteroidia bacterium]|nr:MAG: arginine decarboxylase [Bacteroidia bacterium]